MPHSGSDAARRARTGILIVLVAQLMLVLDATVVNVALPRIATDLDFSTASLSWVLNGYTLAFGGLLLLGGRLGDVRGRLRIFELGLGLFVLASFLGGLAPTASLLVAARVVQGVGAALAAPGVLALLTTSATDATERARAFALFGAVSSGGLSLGLLLGGVLTDLGSWRWTMWINVPIGLTVLLLARRFVTETPRLPGRFDVAGAILATSGAVTLVWALIETPENGWLSARTLGVAGAGVLLLALLFAVERRVAQPMLRLHLLRSPTRLAALGTMALVVGGQLSMFFLVVQYLQSTLGFGPMTSGLAFLPLSLGIFGMSRITPRILARVGAAPMLTVGITGLLGSFLWMSTVSERGDYFTTAFGALLLNGLSAGLAFMPITTLALADVAPQDAGAASGMLQTTQQLGSAVGVAAIVSVYAAGAVPGQFVPGARAAFLTSSAFAGVALLIVLAGPARSHLRTARTARRAATVGLPAAAGADLAPEFVDA